MIITLDDAQLINPSIDQSALDGLEQSIRALTHNKFQNLNIRFYQFKVTNEDTLEFNEALAYLRPNDTIEISNTWSQTGSGLNQDIGVNDGLCVIEEINDKTIKLKDATLFNGSFQSAFITKISYPPDVVEGVKKLLQYDVSMGDKLGIKSESISRMSVTYYDVNSNESINGYPASLFGFIKKYKKMRW
ncbi:hypothetical protein [Lactococcus kimchii]|uniref:hypothetical protein n=1 Tax=Lactococcus sp. S-13 TaxID=2507158 RepID=UPI001022CB35|nr:hypothetical protein [Lactococcus sp. S-13]RZI47964.1 hypothetical protein EQJ87_00030 [Lactococcus sp. S-13]RZI48426.1 hypothetical protein EQJ87_02590 [Lactococcus sp. S-13]RZI48784.1 hypothetical protein EQJ87_04660 [Lactococcus sp. S-13]